MDHNISIQGYQYRVRPVNASDASFMVGLRTDTALAKYLNPTSNKVEDQQKYIEKYLATPDDYYFIIEKISSGDKEGMIALYDFDFDRKKAEWGRWIIRSGSMAALESAILIYKVAFDHLNLEMAYCRTIGENEQVVSFHESCGLKMHTTLESYVLINGVSYDSVEQRMERSVWKEKVEGLMRTAERLAKRLAG